MKGKSKARYDKISNLTIYIAIHHINTVINVL